MKIKTAKHTSTAILELLEEHPEEPWWPTKLLKTFEDRGGTAIHNGLNWLENMGKIKRVPEKDGSRLFIELVEDYE